MTQSASLEIHVMDVGQGDSVLVINRALDKTQAAITAKLGARSVPVNPIDYVPYAIKNGVSLSGTVNNALLVDGGDDEYGGDVLNYMTEQGVLGSKVYYPNLSVVVSHYHDDHMAGLRSVFRRRIDPQTKGDTVRLVDRFRPGTIYMAAGDQRSKPTSQRFAAFLDDVDRATGAPKSRTKQVVVMPGGRIDATNTQMTIDLGIGVSDLPITATVLAAGQGVWDQADEQVIPIESVSSTVDQNDRSIVLVLEYGSFRCLLGGDIAGNGAGPGGNVGANSADTGSKRFFSQHADVESVLGPALEAYYPETGYVEGQAKFTSAGYCTVFKANHHGSASSVDVHLLATLRPLIFACSSGVKARFHNHPTQAVMNRVTKAQTSAWEQRAGRTPPVPNTIQGVYLTEVAAKVRNEPFDVKTYGATIMGDIVIRPVDEAIDAVQSAMKPGTSLYVQVYGTGAQTELLDPTSQLRAIQTRYQDPAKIYPIGPFTHSDLH